MKKKIYIFTAQLGNGHITASNALAEKFLAQGHDIKIFDITKESWAGKIMKFLFPRLPLRILEKIFNDTNTANPSIGTQYTGRLFFGAMVTKIFSLEKLPHEVWCTFPLVTQEIRKIFSGRICIQITDYMQPHLSWAWGDPSKVYCLDMESKNFLQKNFPNILAENFEVQKFPLPRQILEITKKKLHKINTQGSERKKNFLFFFHHVLLGNEEQVLEKFLADTKFSFYNFTILAGENTQFFARYKKNPQIKILGWVDTINALYVTADAVAGKCGGAFISEVMELQIPLYITGVFSGQEKGNKKFLEKYYSKKLLK